MKSIITSLFYIFFISLNSFGQHKVPDRGKFSGKITDAEKGGALAGATIYFPDLNISAVAQNDGMFTINNIPAGRHILNVSFVGYKSVVENIDIEGSVTKNYSLTPGIMENAEVVITGSASSSQIKNVAIPVTVVKRDDLLKGASTNIIDAISRLPGISQLSTGPAISKQGPASLMYGSDGLAGVINIISNSPIPQGTIKANINSNYQTNEGLYAFNGNIAGNINGFNWNVYGTYKAAHDYKNKYDGYVFNSKFNNTDYGGSIGLNKSWGYTHLTYSKFDQKLGLVEGERDATGKFVKIVGVDMNGDDSTAVATDKDFKSYKPYIGRQRITHQKLVLDNVFFLPNNKGRFSVTAGWQLSQRKEFPDITEPSVPGLYFHLRTFTYDIKYFLPSQNKWQTAIGVSGMQQQNQNLGIEYLIPAYHFNDAGGFIYTKKTFNKLTVSGGARYDNRKLNSMSFEEGGNTKFAAFNKNFGNISASMGATYDITGTVTVKLNMARGFRAPNIAELAANGVHEGTIKYEYGNTALRSETSLETDAGIDLHTEHITFSGTLFYNNIRNYIFSRKLNSIFGGDSIPVVANTEGFSAFKYFQTTANLYGTEIMLDIHPHPLDWLHFQNTFSYVRATSGFKTDSTENLPNIPPARWLLELQATIKNAGPAVKNLYFNVGTDYSFKQDKVFSAYQTETATAGYMLLNAGIGANIVDSKKQTLFSLFFSANNITDVAYQNHLSRLKYAPENLVTGRSGVFNMGRNFSIKINVPLNFTVL